MLKIIFKWKLNYNPIFKNSKTLETVKKKVNFELEYLTVQPLGDIE